MARLLSVVFSLHLLASQASAQQPGKLTPEVHPLLPSWECSVAGGCVQKNTSIVLDSDYRWTHTVNGYDSCKGNGLNATLCPDAKTCSANCALEGVDYSSYGVFTNGSELTLDLFVNKTDVGTSLSSPRVYLLANDTTYDMFSLLNRELTFDVDLSQLPCGTNGALYLSEMSATGGQSELNPAGAAYGTGYCDAQCPTPAFINGEANIANNGACCNEMDIWEANRAATAFTPHPCNVTGVYKCSGDLCGNTAGNKYSSVCDKDGCDYNAYRLGQVAYYQPTATNTTGIDTSRKFTVVTQFLTTTGNATGTLREIRRLYVQDDTIIENAIVQVPGIDKGNSITDEFCAQEKNAFGGTNAFASQGGLAGMGAALGRGMVLVFSVWDDAGSSMKWLDATFPDDANPATDPGTARGPCNATEGAAADLLTTAPWASVKFSNIKSGEIGSTYKGKNKVSKAN